MGQRTQGVYTGSAPCGEGKGLIQFEVYCLCLDNQGANPLDLAFDLLFLALNRRRVIPLYTQVDARWLTESRPAHKRVRPGDLTTRFTPTGLKPSLGLGPFISYPLEPPSSIPSWALSL